MSKPKILFVTRERPLPGRSGGEEYTLSIANYLSESGFEVRVLSTQTARHTSPSANNQGTGVLRSETLSELNAERTRTVNKTRIEPEHTTRSMTNWLKHQPIVHRLANFLSPWFRFTRLRNRLFANPATTDEVAIFVEEFAAFRPDVIIVVYTFMAGIFDQVAADSRSLKITLTAEVLSDRYGSYVQRGVFSGHWPWTIREESQYLRKADLLVAIQPENQRMIEQMAPGIKVVCSPIAANPIPIAEDLSVATGCVFVGGGANHNLIGLNWLFAEVWPKVVDAIPDARLEVYGSVCAGIKETPTGVSCIGPVASLDDAYAKAAFVIVPLIVGGGLKIKLVEALQYGKAAVCTSIGAQGLEELENVAIEIQDEPIDFANAVIMMMQNHIRAKEMGTAALYYAENKLSSDACYLDLKRELQKLLRKQ